MPTFKEYDPFEIFEGYVPRHRTHRHSFRLAQGLHFQNGSVVIGQPDKDDNNSVWVCDSPTHEGKVVVASFAELMQLIHDQHARMKITVLDVE